MVDHIFPGGFPGLDLAGGHVAIKARVGDDDNYIRVVGLSHFLQGLANGFRTADPAVAFVVFRFFPDGDGGSGDADDADLYAGYCFYDPPLERFYRGAFDCFGVGGKPGELCLAPGYEHVFQTVIQFVIAHGHGVIAKVVHGGHHGVDFRGFTGAHVHLVDSLQGCALDGVAAIEQEVVRILASGFVDERCDFG